MQAQPQSTPAARIPTTAPPLSPPTPSAPTSSQQPSLADTTGLAHDAGNLLAALTLYCDLLSLPGVLRPEHQHYATELRTISNTSSRLIGRLIALPFLAASNAAAPAATAAALPPALLTRRSARATDAISPTPDPAAMLHSLAPVLQRIASGAAAVTVSVPSSLPTLSFPPEIIERIVVNLVRNAAEAIRLQHSNTTPSSDPESPAPESPNSEFRNPESLPATGEIQVALAVIARRVQLTVEDNGPGMPPAIASAYLQPTPLPEGASRGLGHRIVHQLVAASAGQLSIRVRPGHGTIFCIKWNLPETSSSETLLSDPNLTRTPA